MNEVSFSILKIVVSVSVALITAFLIPYLKTKINRETQEQIAEVVSVAVKAAQQTMQGGTVKKETVMDYATRWAALHNIKVTKEQIEQLLESAVFAMKHGDKEK